MCSTEDHFIAVRFSVLFLSARLKPSNCNQADDSSASWDYFFENFSVNSLSTGPENKPLSTWQFQHLYAIFLSFRTVRNSISFVSFLKIGCIAVGLSFKWLLEWWGIFKFFKRSRMAAVSCHPMGSVYGLLFVLPHLRRKSTSPGLLGGCPYFSQFKFS